MNKFALLFLVLPLSAVADETCVKFLEEHRPLTELANLNCLCNGAQTAVAVCTKESLTECFVIDTMNAANVTTIQQSNLRKLGHAKKTEYESVSTAPKEWLSSKENTHLVSFETRAWLKGQRYTISGPVAVVNGEYGGQ